MVLPEATEGALEGVVGPAPDQGEAMKIGVIGAGISGLTAALRLARSGRSVEIFQREKEVGGLLGSFDLGGTRIERFYHFLCAGDTGYFELCRELGLADRIRFTRSLTGFYHDGRLFPFTTAADLLRFTSISLPQRLRFGIFALESMLRTRWQSLDRRTAKSWLIGRIGRRAYDVIWEPLLSLKFGELANQISAAWVWHRVHRVARSKGRMGYLEGGTALLLDRLTQALENLGVRVHPGRPVAQILVERRRVAGLQLVDGDVHRCDSVISTIPLPLVASLLPTECGEYAERLRSFRYIGVACVSIKLNRKVTPFFWLNVNDPRIPFNGIIEFTNLNPLAGEHVAYVPYYVPTDSATYATPPDELVERTWRGMKLVAPHLTDDDRIAAHVARAPFAQAICAAGFSAALPPQRSEVGGLHLLDSVFLYPEDRTQSGNILKATECTERLLRDE